MACLMETDAERSQRLCVNIRALCVERRVVTFSLSLLIVEFPEEEERHLRAAVDDLVRSRRAIQLHVLRAELDPSGGIWETIRNNAPTASSWTASLTKKLSMFTNGTQQEQPVQPDIYAIVDLIRTSAERLLEEHPNETCTYGGLYQESLTLVKDNLSFQLILLHLLSSSLITVLVMNNEKFIQFTDGLHSSGATITSTELEVIRLKERIEELERSCDKLDKQVKRLRKEAEDQARAGERRQARRILQRKDLVEQSLQQQERTCRNLRLMLSSIQRAQSADRELDVCRDAIDLYDNVREFVADDVTAMQKDISDVVTESVADEDTLNAVNGKSDNKVDAEMQEILSLNRSQTGASTTHDDSMQTEQPDN